MPNAQGCQDGIKWIFDIDPSKISKQQKNVVWMVNPGFHIRTNRKVGAFYNGGSMGIFFVFCPIQLKFCSWLYKKRWHTSWKFQFEKTSNKKVTNKKPLTILYEMNSKNVVKRKGSRQSMKLFHVSINQETHTKLFELFDLQNMKD